ncbi:MAG: thioredoxin-disulfide reductase [Clostridia bacterium]|nr:thioredoxin-disulfide reductase [Clostridia bacterium]
MNGATSIYDIIVIGGGPAGYTAALYGSREGRSVLVIEKAMAGGQMALTYEIENYPGFDEPTDGYVIAEKMKRAAEKFGALSLRATVKSVSFDEDVKSVVTSKGTFEARSVIISTGARPRLLGLEREEALTGMGVSYCAHCDAMFYRGKTVMVVGGGNTAATDVLTLSRVAKKVYLVHRRDTLRASSVYGKKIDSADNVEFIPTSAVTFLGGEEKLSFVRVKDLKTGKEREIALNGLFISIGRIPETELFKDKLSLDDSGYIIAGEDTKSSVDGVFAAGDVRTKELRQIVTAASDGAVAAHMANEYLDSKVI